LSLQIFVDLLADHVSLRVLVLLLLKKIAKTLTNILNIDHSKAWKPKNKLSLACNATALMGRECFIL
jgi:hypothetical protein